LIIFGLRSMLLPYSDVLRVVDLGCRAPGDASVDVTLHDPTLPAPGRPTVESLRTDPANGLVVMYSLSPARGTVVEMLGRGCAGFVDKSASAEDLVEVLTYLAGDQPEAAAAPSTGPGWAGQEYGLSQRESEMLSMITRGFTNDDISTRAYLSPNTVKTYIRSAYRKLGITRRPQAVRWGMEHGMAGPPQTEATVVRSSVAV
jgi:DNA-binding NarL/FixJ family response regulator